MRTRTSSYCSGWPPAAGVRVGIRDGDGDEVRADVARRVLHLVTGGAGSPFAFLPITPFCAANLYGRRGMLWAVAARWPRI